MKLTEASCGGRSKLSVNVFMRIWVRLPPRGCDEWRATRDSPGSARAVLYSNSCSLLAGRSLHSRAVALADDEEENTRSPQRSRPAGNQRFAAVCSAITSPALASLATSRSPFSEPHSPPAAVACPLAVDNGPCARSLRGCLLQGCDTTGSEWSACRKQALATHRLVCRAAT